MADDLNNRGPQDRSRINLSEEWEVQYWTKKFGVTKEKLTEAVKAVGASAEAVQKHLGR
ncbi:DUF3606 domain-containing protein [Pseudomonas putida CSV86]|uniref:DUF3606 domain-containing protein n=1 Tax=Pseudomonas bharatica CSV86 TaxID=1005395 RepID=L1LTC6_9PSED|nr:MULTISPECIES: DUF3606 domain-containing protein [Pseudomonas]MDG9882333.1 DUF3606 domain-containing protein [Pseudomonas sp. GD04058]NNJ15096.1 DUF3606 domain-containing protein [Pseudomonas bharatica CSV86]